MIKDTKGYDRIDRSSNLWHRKVAYYKIYLKNREKYFLPFSKYEVHHKDGDKKNNLPTNLEILTPEEHVDKHIRSEQNMLDKITLEVASERKSSLILFKKVIAKMRISSEELTRMISQKVKKLDGLISRDAALQIIAAENGLES